MELNDYQKTAVLDEHNACLVRANVGSGKNNGSYRKDPLSSPAEKNPPGKYDRSDLYK